MLGLQEASSRWDSVHEQRHLLSPFTDAFCAVDGEMNHAQKSRFLKNSTNRGRDIIYTFDKYLPHYPEGHQISHSLYSSNLQWFSIQMEVMNALHYRGDDGQRGTTVLDVVTGKMNTLLRKWIARGNASTLQQIHLHIDDPTLLIPQKAAEQSIRDDNRRPFRSPIWKTQPLETLLSLLSLQMNLWCRGLIWSVTEVLKMSVHLFCAAVAAQELLEECNRNSSIFLHCGNFALPQGFVGKKPNSFRPKRLCKDYPNSLEGRFILSLPDQTNENLMQDCIIILRDTCLVFQVQGGLCLGEHIIRHGEAETRFVSVFKQYTKPYLPGVGAAGQQKNDRMDGCVLLSDYTDVLVILLTATCMQGYGVKHVLNDTVHNIDVASARLDLAGLNKHSVAAAYAFGGCDYTPGVYGIGHEVFFEFLMRYIKSIEPCFLVGSNSSALKSMKDYCVLLR